MAQAVRQYEEDLLQEAEVNQKAPEQRETANEAEQVVQDKKQDLSAENDQNEPYYHYTVDTKDPDPWIQVHKFKILSLVLVGVVAIAGNWFYGNHKVNLETKSYISEPKLNDLYYIDFRLIKSNLRPTEKFRMAKVADITGDIVTLKYSSYFYPQKHELNETIRYAQLRFEKFFQEKRNNFSITQLKSMIESGAIFQARRPEGNMLDGNLVVPDIAFANSKVFMPGKKENFAGLEYLKRVSEGDNAQLAFDKFKKSADLGFAQGQVNLAQMYLNDAVVEKGVVEKDLIEALAWFKKGALQAHEPSIMKYTIVCQQVESCAIADFYQELVKVGVNIEFATKKYTDSATTKELERLNEERFKNAN